jgi:hypothetical protein
MNQVRILLAPSAVAFLMGCATADQIVLDSSPRTPTTSVDIYKDGQTPEHKYKVIAELSFLGPREEELRAEKRFIGQAEKKGGNGILFDVAPAGEKGGGLGGISIAWVFRGKVIVYQ